MAANATFRLGRSSEQKLLYDLLALLGWLFLHTNFGSPDKGESQSSFARQAFSVLFQARSKTDTNLV